MTTRSLKATVRCSAAELIERLEDDLAFPAHAADIISVADAGEGLRRWVIAFRGGTAQWVQREAKPTRRTAGERSAPPTHGRPPLETGERPHRIGFEQVEGDFQRFDGSWTATDLPDGCEVVFEVAYRTNVPHLSGAIDAAVGRVLVRSAHQILSAVCGPVRVTSGTHHLCDLPGILHLERTPTDALR